MSPWVTIRRRLQTNRELREELDVLAAQRNFLADDCERLEQECQEYRSHFYAIHTHARKALILNRNSS